MRFNVITHTPYYSKQKGGQCCMLFVPVSDAQHWEQPSPSHIRQASASWHLASAPQIPPGEQDPPGWHEAQQLHGCSESGPQTPCWLHKEVAPPSRFLFHSSRLILSGSNRTSFGSTATGIINGGGISTCTSNTGL